MRYRLALCALSGAALAALVLAPDSKADANSFLGYVHSHQINTGMASDSKVLHAGMFACESLHAGQTPDDVVAGVRMSFMDVRGLIDAAQRELCPDTLH